jgi:hypothetical protein
MDAPHIFSDDQLVMLEPHCLVDPYGGLEINFLKKIPNTKIKWYLFSM